MKFIPVKTRVLQPPKDDLFSVLDEYLQEVKEKDVICISSKIVAISQGRCLAMDGIDKDELIRKEADYVIERDYHKSPLLVAHNTFLGAGGIDESNGNGYYILSPEKVFETAGEIYKYLQNRFNIKEVGVIITDSRSGPFRMGAIGVSLGWWGIVPLQSHVGREDLFGRKICYERSNMVDSIAVAANLVMGEVDECQPVVIARDIPQLGFTDGLTKDNVFVSPEEDFFRVLYRNLLS